MFAMRPLNKNPIVFLTVVFACLLLSSPAFAQKTYTMKAGDTLWELSNKFYGDPTLYPIFLECNKIDNPRAIPIGKTIIVPNVDEIKKISREHDAAKRQELINQISGKAPEATGLNRPLIEGGKEAVVVHPAGKISGVSFQDVLSDKVDVSQTKKVEVTAQSLPNPNPVGGTTQMPGK